MYGLPQSRILANQQLVAHLKPYGYYETSTRSLFRNLTRDTSFTLVVDNYSVSTTSCANLDHLNAALNAKYTTEIDRTGAFYLGMTLMWDYEQRHVNVSMPGYVERALALQSHPPNTA